jgi:hypothetical protein
MPMIITAARCSVSRPAAIIGSVSSAEAILNVLDAVRTLYERGFDVPPGPAAVQDKLASLGFGEMDPGDTDVLVTIGVVLRLLFRHANADIDEMFAAARRDLIEVGRGIDDRAFDRIIEHLRDR